MSDISWQPITDLLERFARSGKQARLWLRDDDAIEPTPALDRLIDLCERHDVPLLLAVIPEPATPTLARRIAGTLLVQPCQHGFHHKNHAPEGARARELGLDRPIDLVTDELADGRRRLQRLFGASLRNVLVPPWNRIDPDLIPSLPSLGFRALSTFGHEPLAAAGGITEINSHLDIIDWRNGRVGREHARLIRKLAGELESAFEIGNAVGILAHHLVHDETAWSFLEALFQHTAGHSAARWISVDALMA